LVLSASPAQLVLADGTGTTAGTSAQAAFRTPSIGKVSIGGSSYIEIKDVRQLGTTVRFTLSIYNGGSSDLQFIDYWVRLRSDSGSSFSPTLYEADKDKNRIAPKTTETFSFYATVNESTKLHDLAFDVIRWDFSVSSFQRTLGTLKAPASYNPTAPAGSHLATAIDGVSVNARIKNVNISRTSDKYTASIIFEYENTGSKSLAIPAYEYSIVTAEGLMYPLTVSGLPEDARLHPRFKEEVTLRGELPGSLENENWTLVLSEKQGTVSNVPAMSFKLPQSTPEEVADAIPVGEAKELLVSDQKIEAKVVRTVRNQNDRNFLATIRFSFANQGTKSVTLPKYTFQIETSSGLTYPVTVDLANVSLDPLVEKEVELKATLPLSVGSNDWILTMHEPSADSDSNAVGSELAKFSLSNENPSGLGQGSVYEYSNEAGTYLIQFNDVQRIPWEDEDIVSASFTIRNRSANSLPLPDLAGYFMLDDKIKVDATLLQQDSVLAVKPYGAVSVRLYGKIPYTYEYSNLKVNLQENTGGNDGDLINIVDFSYTGDDPTELKVIEVGKKHKIEGSGRTAEVSIRDVRTYEGTDYKLFTALVDVKNLERRFTDVATLVGHFETPDGLVFPAEISKIVSKVSPSGIATIMASASLPSGIDSSKMKLVLGEGVSNGKFTDGSGESDAFINVVAFQLPAESKEPKSNFTDLSFFPYTLSLSNVSARVVTTESFAFRFDYTLSKNPFIANEGSDHSVLIEFRDSVGSLTFSKQFTLDRTDGEHQEDSLDLSVGSYSKYFEITDKYILLKLEALSSYKINVYDVYNGQKKLLATQSVSP